MLNGCWSTEALDVCWPMMTVSHSFSGRQIRCKLKIWVFCASHYDNSSVAISAKSGTSVSLFSENYNIDFYFLILFWSLVAVFCYLSSPCAWLPKWRSRVCTQDPVDPHEGSTVFLQGSPCWGELRREHCCFALFPMPIRLHMVLSPGLEGMKLIFLQEPYAIQGWSQRREFLGNWLGSCCILSD